MMVMVLRRAEVLGLLDAFPNLAAYLARGTARPAYQRAFDAQYAVFAANRGTDADAPHQAGSPCSVLPPAPVDPAPSGSVRRQVRAAGAGQRYTRTPPTTKETP